MPVVGDEMFRLERAADQAAVVGLGSDLMGADGNGPVAFGLRQCGEADARGGEAGKQKGRAQTHGISRWMQWMREVLRLGTAAALILINPAARSGGRSYGDVLQPTPTAACATSDWSQ